MFKGIKNKKKTLSSHSDEFDMPARDLSLLLLRLLCRSFRLLCWSFCYQLHRSTAVLRSFCPFSDFLLKTASFTLVFRHAPNYTE